MADYYPDRSSYGMVAVSGWLDMEVVMKLNEWMEQKEKSGYRLAKEMDLSESTISRIRSGQRAISSYFKLKFLTTYGAENYRLVFPQDPISEFLERN